MPLHPADPEHAAANVYRDEIVGDYTRRADRLATLSRIATSAAKPRSGPSSTGLHVLAVHDEALRTMSTLD